MLMFEKPRLGKITAEDVFPFRNDSDFINGLSTGRIKKKEFIGYFLSEDPVALDHVIYAANSDIPQEFDVNRFGFEVYLPFSLKLNEFGGRGDINFPFDESEKGQIKFLLIGRRLILGAGLKDDELMSNILNSKYQKTHTFINSNDSILVTHKEKLKGKEFKKIFFIEENEDQVLNSINLSEISALSCVVFHPRLSTMMPYVFLDPSKRKERLKQYAEKFAFLKNKLNAIVFSGKEIFEQIAIKNKNRTNEIASYYFNDYYLNYRGNVIYAEFLSQNCI